MIRIGLCSVVLVLNCFVNMLAQPARWNLVDGNVEFVSEAPLEIIKASSSELRGILEADTRKFAFSVPMKSFMGFNSPLQRDHFQENYLEIDKYPEATFAGRIIEPIDISVPGLRTVRAKGIFSIHGVANERIIRVSLEISDGKIYAYSSFPVLLSDHQIQVPRIVNQKISETIQVDITASFETEVK